NRPEFHIVDAAAMLLGAVPFSLYNTSPAEQIAFVMGDAGNRLVVAEPRFLDVVREAAGDGVRVVALDELDDGDEDFDLEPHWRAVAPADLLTLIYTSGTTGPPKGVQLTHANMVAELRALDPILQPRLGGRAVSYLPAAHIADRWASHYSPMAYGTQVTCCPDPRELFVHIAAAKPTHFGGVPRIWEKLKAALEAGIESEADQDKQEAARWAIATGLEKVRREQAGETLSP